MLRLVQVLWGFFLTILPSIAGRVLLALGIGYVTFSGFNLTLNWGLDYVKTTFGSMGAEMVGFMGFMFVDKAIGMIFSAYTAALTVKTLNGSGITKMVTKAPVGGS